MLCILFQFVHQPFLLLQSVGKQFRISSRQIYQISFRQGITFQRTEKDHFSQSVQLGHVFPIHKIESRISGYCYGHVPLIFCFFYPSCPRSRTNFQQAVYIHMLFYQFRCLIHLSIHPLLCAPCQAQMSGRNFQSFRVGYISQTFHTDVPAGFLQILIMRG